MSPSLPPGLSLNTTTGVISGTPSAEIAAANYTVTASNTGGSTVAQLRITVNPAWVLPVINSFNVTAGPVPIGAGGVLAWDVTGATSISVDQGIGTLATATGTINVAPATTTSYTMTATNQGGSVTSAATMNVNTTPFNLSSFTASPTQVTFGGSTTLSWTYSGLPLTLTLNGSATTGFSSDESPVRRQSFSLEGMNAAGSSRRTIKVAAQGVDLLAGNTDGVGSVDGTGASARFFMPFGNTVDAAGNVYVADTNNSTIRKISPTGIVTTLAGTPGVVGSADGTGAVAQFNTPIGVAVDGMGNVFVGDQNNHTIRKISPAGAVTTFAGTPGIPGSADGSGIGAQFWWPFNLALDIDGNVYVADQGNATIRKITNSGVVSTLAGSPSGRGTADGTGAAALFENPTGLALDSTGNIYVADYTAHTIRKISPVGVVTTLAGTPDIPGTIDGNGSAARFNRPSSLATDGVGNVYVADSANQTIRKISPSGTVSTIAGTVGTWGWAEGSGTSAIFYSPWGIASDQLGNLFVADTNNNSIRKISPSLAVSTLAGTAGVQGTTDGIGPLAQFSNAVGVAVDGSGNTYVADRMNSTIRKISLTGEVTTLAGTAGLTGSTDGLNSVALFNRPTGVAIDGAGNLFVADARNSTIRKVGVNGVVSTIAGTAGLNGSADGTGAVARFSSPYGLAVDASGNVYVADTGNQTIRKISPTGVVTTLAGLAGSGGSKDGTGTTARFYAPMGVAVDAAGNVYVADSSFCTVRKISALGVVTTLAGKAGFQGSDDGAGVLARFAFPQGLAVNGAGDIFVADTYNGSIRKVSPTGVVCTVAGFPTKLGFQPGPLPGYLGMPRAVALTPDGDLVVTMANGVVQVTAPQSTTTPTITAFSASPNSIAPGQSSTLSWSVTGATSLSISSGVGAVIGSNCTVRPAATTAYTMTATNATGSTTYTLTITVKDTAPSLLAYGTNPAVYTKGIAITANHPSNTGGTIVSYSVNPALPTGLSLNPSTGAITGTPSAITAAGFYTVEGMNTGGSTTGIIRITVVDAAPRSLSYGTNPATYTKGIQIPTSAPSNLGGAVVVYGVSPNLPTGLTFNTNTGVISGTPTAITGSANYTITATNTGGFTTANLTIIINDVAPSSLAYSINPASYTVGTAITSNTPSNGGGAVVSYSVLPTLPAGLSLNTSTGVISGTPTVVTASSTYTVTATNSGGQITVGVSIVVISTSAYTYTYSVTPTTLDFGSVQIGSTSAEMTFQVTNTGTGALSLDARKYGSSYLISRPVPVSLAPGGSCTIGVRFSPVSIGATSSEFIAIIFSEIAANTYINLTGTGISADGLTYTVSVTPLSIDFGSETVGMTSAEKTFQITNTGTGALTLTVGMYGSGYLISTPAPASLAPGGSCTIGVKFRPVAFGATSSEFVAIIFSEIAANTYINLTGTGISADGLTYTVSVTPLSIDFGSETVGMTSAEKTFQITNTGTGALTLTVGMYGSGYLISTPAPASLAPGGSCTIGVKFRPVAFGATSSEFVAIICSEIASNTYVSFSGTGL